MVFIKRIDEPDFGCEGVPDDMIVTDRVTFLINGVEEIMEIPEKIVWELKLDENMEISDDMYNKVLKFIK